jgi:hypothetical protein
MHRAGEFIAVATLVVSSISLVVMGYELHMISRLLKILAFNDTSTRPTGTDPFVIGGYAVFIWRSKEQVWALERDCCKPGYTPVAPEIPGAYDSQVVRKAGVSKPKGE